MKKKTNKSAALKLFEEDLKEPILSNRIEKLNKQKNVINGRLEAFLVKQHEKLEAIRKHKELIIDAVKLNFGDSVHRYATPLIQLESDLAATSDSILDVQKELDRIESELHDTESKIFDRLFMYFKFLKESGDIDSNWNSFFANYKNKI